MKRVKSESSRGGDAHDASTNKGPPSKIKKTSDAYTSSAKMSDSDCKSGQAVTKPKGLVLKNGRVRLPDKLLEYLNKDVLPHTLFWHEGGMSFSFDTSTAQTELLDKYFKGTKLSSFTRSLNRWGFKRIFHATMPKSFLSYMHPYFRRDQPELVSRMRMTPLNQERNGRDTNEFDKKTPADSAASVSVSASASASSISPVSSDAARPIPTALASAANQDNPQGMIGAILSLDVIEKLLLGTNQEQHQQSPAVQQGRNVDQPRQEFMGKLQLRGADVQNLLQTILSGQAGAHQQLNMLLNHAQTYLLPRQSQAPHISLGHSQCTPAPGLQSVNSSDVVGRALQALISKEQQKQAIQELLLKTLNQQKR